MSNITKETILRRRPDQLFSEIDGEVVMLSIKNEEYYYLNGVGSDIWNSLSNKCTFYSLIKSLQRKYDVVEDLCIEQVKQYLDELLIKDLIEIIRE